jgi:two-component system, chemotaxis family, protein-glutamate methylesterase/glutaminase
MNDKIKVLVVDDDITYRQILLTVIDRIADAECIGTAASGQIALRKSAVLQPDLVLLERVMPDMDGIATLRQLKQEHPAVEVIVMSNINKDNTKQTLRSLQIGALDFITKPTITHAEQGINELVNYLQPFIHLIQTKKYAAFSCGQEVIVSPKYSPQPLPPIALDNIKKGQYDLCVIGISTGGPKALDQLVPQLDARLPCPIIIVQHMPPLFTEALAQKLNEETQLQVSEVKGDEKLSAGHIYIAQGGKHLVLRESLDGSFYLAINDMPPVNNCRPSVDVLFRSVAEVFNGKVLAIIMTGMGCDGTDGVRLLKHNKAKCLIQDEASSIVWGMPRSVHDAGLADEIVPLSQLGARIAALVL